MKRANFLEQTAPPEILAMLAAYVEASGLAVSLSYERGRVLAELIAREFAPADVRAVTLAIKRKIARGDGGFTETSILFRNVLGDPDVFEERALLLRQQLARKAGAKPKPEVAHERTLPDGSKVAVLGPAGFVDAVVLADPAAALRGLADEITKGGRP